MYLVDTNVVSELRKVKSGRADLSVVNWALSVAPNTTFLSAISVYEIQFGILRLAARNPAEAQRLEAWLSQTVIPSYSGRILPFDHDIAFVLADMMATRTYPYRDAIIAATAQLHGYALVTRNSRDFEGLPVRVIDPWKFN